ncbi:MAG TPA: hypothetical protein VI670_27145 [Thermoanaerobaculia bacterium]
MPEETTWGRIGTALIESAPTLLIVVGTGLLILGLAGGVTYGNWLPIGEPFARLAAGSVGLALITVGIWLSIANASGNMPNASRYGIEITQPRTGDSVAKIAVRGTIKKPTLPRGFSLHVFRHYPGKDEFVPMSNARIDKQAKTWESGVCDIGGKPGEPRDIAVCLVGPAGKVLLDYYKIAAEKHRDAGKELEKLGQPGSWAPPIQATTPDMIECARVAVRRA